MSIEDLGNELYIQVFQQFFIENPEPLTYFQKKTISKRVTEIEYKINNIGATRTRQVQKQVEAFQGFNVIRVVEEEYRLQITREELATALLYCALLPKIAGLENYIPEYDGTIAKYKEWRDKVEEAFNIKGISKLMIFGRYSGNMDDGYTHQAKGHDGSADAANHPVAEFVVNFNKQVFAVIATKLKGTALSCYKNNRARINCWFRGDINDQADVIRTLKVPTGYPVSLNQLYNATGWHATAIRSAFKNEFAVDATTAPLATVVQVGFREILDEQFITEAVQETYQQQIGAITTEADFWQQTSAIFHSIRQNKVDSGKAQTDLKINRFLKKEASTKKFKRINNIDTTRRNDKRNDNCFNCNQPGHYARNCPLQRKKESFNRIETQRNSQGKFVQKIKYCSICGNARPHHSRNCQRNNKYSYNGKFGKGPVPMALNKIKTNYNKDKGKNYNKSYNKNYRSNKPPFRKKVHNVKESRPLGSNKGQTKVQHLEDIEEETEEEYEYYSQGEEEYESEEEKPKIRNVVTTKDFRNKKNYF
ncbi:hypothetical protein F8M41_018542 [Gigaspora margarita]|uniref:CCHC-type domain-containing protein n=1 Tax=Gigaspora margarita TaxID=4874 RepID=A0A8H4ALD0_GIGMA|nr:hypothetical protein F8M41_018542 [Gigaspora margarita]